MNDQVEALLARSHALGADPCVTNFAGGNTSCKVAGVDPATGEAITLLWVKGSGGDLGTLTREGLAVLSLKRILALRDRYPGEEHEDDMVDLLDHCRFGRGGATPSIDTPLHAFLPSKHIDHPHPDAVIALAAARDGEALVKECYGTEVGWVPYRRPGFELALQLHAMYRDHPGLRGIVLGGHGLISWGETSEECERNTLEIIARATSFLATRGRADPLGVEIAERRALPADARRREAASLAPVIRGLCSTDKRVVGWFHDEDVVLDFLSRAEAPRLAALGTSCPDHFLRTKVRPLFLDALPAVSREQRIERLRALHERYRAEYSEYYRQYATPSSPAIRGADPAIVLLPGVGMFSFGADAQTARVAGEFFINAMNVIRGAEAVSTYEPIDELEKFRIEYWELEEKKLKLRPPPRPLDGRVALVTGGASGIGRAIAHRFVAAGASVVISDLDLDRARRFADELGSPDRAVAVAADVSDETAVERAFAEACLRYGGLDIVVNNAGLSLSRPLLETSVEDWDRQHGVMARGSFLVSRAAARVMSEQNTGGDIVYIISKNGVAAGPNNLAYGAAKADQAHQVRLLATELGAGGIRVNGINPDGVVRGSGIFANGWGAERAAVYGIPEEDLGKFYADRTLLKREVLPEHIAEAVLALVGGALSLTTGAIIPVDGGVPIAFLR